jgi:integrase
MRRSHVARNVAAPAFVDSPSGARQKHEAPKLDELEHLLDVTRDDRRHAMLPVALGLGLRRGEVLGL